MRMKSFAEVVRVSMIWVCLLLSGMSAVAQDWLYTVKPGDTVWDLSHNMLKDWRYWKEILRHNNIKDATTIRPGMHIAIPLYVVREETSQARVEAVHGDVRVTWRGASESLPLKPGMSLSVGDKVATDSNSTALLILEDHSAILMQERSELEFSRLRKLGGRKSLDAGLFVGKGGLKMDANPSHYPDSSYEIQTAAANSAVRGTGFRIGVEGQSSRTEVLEGLVSVGNALGQVDVPKNFGTVVKKDEPPVKPIKLLDAPDLGVFPGQVRYLPKVIKLNTPSGAVGYHVQVAKDADFMELLLDRKVKERFMIDQGLPDGNYYVRVRAVDSRGLEGKNAQTRFQLAARPEAPLVRAPLPGAVLHEGELLFSWAEAEGVERYLFELGPDQDFSRIKVSRETTDTELKLPVAQGIWYFRLTSITPEGKKGPPGHPVKMEVLPVPKVPEPKPPATEEGKLVLAWQNVDGVAAYNVQLATDKDFQNLIVDKTVDQGSLTLPRPPSGHYYMRLRSIDSEGYEGNFGAAQSFEVKPESYWPLAIFGIVTALLLL
ncbi:hypothetical protein TBH_C2250 [Thiolapillus brandeum]|uniref:LysM domain-containing protein n=1 Tax=Thiolapillus brandeum TaxID=1076588 RepID=A0A7U6GK74_9GAMM|nr:hypothetical protein TBH_C2250 [Thiolapillus brandeum]